MVRGHGDVHPGFQEHPLRGSSAGDPSMRPNLRAKRRWKAGRNMRFGLLSMEPPIALALGGGAARGFAHIGVLKVLGRRRPAVHR